MDDRRKKSRSIAVESKSSSKRPELSERHHSSPAVNRRPESQSKRVSVSTKASTKAVETTSKRSSKASGTQHDVEGSTKRLSDRRSGQFPQTNESGETINLSFVVLGGEGVGKGYFVRHALDLRKASGSPISSSKVSSAGSLYRIRLIELEFEDADLTGRRVAWPKYLNNEVVPIIHGVFCLYDVADQETVANVPQALAALTNSDIPCMLIACNTHIPTKQREVQSNFHHQVHRSFANVAISETSKEDPESQKRCLRTMLTTVTAQSQDRSAPQSRRQSASGDANVAQQDGSRDTSPHKPQSRSRSNSRLRASRSKDLLLNLPSRPPVIDESGDENSGEDTDRDGIELPAPLKSKLKVDTSNIPQAKSRPEQPHTPVSEEDEALTSSQLISPSEPSHPNVPETPESYYVKSMLRPGTADTADSRAFQTFLNMDEDNHDDSPSEETMHRLRSLSVDENGRSETGVPFRDLVERLLVLPASKQDSKFVPSFLCLYRMFATPRQLLMAIIDQFVKTEKSNMVKFTRVAEMLRYLQVLGQWTAIYPGDFASVHARELATTFVQSLEKSREFGAAGRELKNNLDTEVLDDDLDWAYYDSSAAPEKESAPVSKRTPGSSSASIPSSMTDSGLKLTDSRSTGTDDDSQHSTAPSTASNALRKGNSSQSYTNLLTLQNARKQAKTFHPHPKVKLSKMQWHQFMEIPVELLAREITRIDWTMYSSIRPRDFVRHVTLSEQKRASRRNDNISIMVRQFNHLALFVSGMILLRDKPKHRARAMEKFMSLAWKVRQLNNYNSLGAIVAGINGHEIGRLGQTRDLIPPEVQKQFLRLTILMGISRSHAAYRMAWENSFAERIPFIPLLRQDLTMAATANKTLIGSNVNWKKFEIMGEAVVGVQRSFETPYTLPLRTSTSDETVRLILESKILEEAEDSADPRGELYERSVQLEPQPGADARKKFDWLRR